MAPHPFPSGQLPASAQFYHLRSESATPSRSRDATSKEYHQNMILDCMYVHLSFCLPQVIKWCKKPREMVKKGDTLLEIEIAGSVLLEMRAEVNGYMGAQLVTVKIPTCLACTLLNSAGTSQQSVSQHGNDSLFTSVLWIEFFWIFTHCWFCASLVFWEGLASAFSCSEQLTSVCDLES